MLEGTGSSGLRAALGLLTPRAKAGACTWSGTTLAIRWSKYRSTALVKPLYVVLSFMPESRSNQLEQKGRAWGLVWVALGRVGQGGRARDAPTPTLSTRRRGARVAWPSPPDRGHQPGGNLCPTPWL